MTKVSVAIATYNGGRFLREQLDSIHRQTLPPVEIIICDDGSKDDTLEVARRFAAEVPYRVTIDAHGERLGYSENFIRAIHQCSGEVVVLCDQDDVWDPSKLATVCAVFQDPTVMAVVNRIQTVTEALEPVPIVLPPASMRGRQTLYNLNPQYNANGMQLQFRREPIVRLLREKPPMSQWYEGPASFDERVIFLAALTGAVHFLPDVLGVWRRHDTATTGSLNHTKAINTTAHRIKMGLASSSNIFEHLANMSQSKADCAAQAEQVAQEEGIRLVEGGKVYHQRRAEMFRRRAKLHGSGVGLGKRLKTFGEMLLANSYRSNRRGGLGPKSFLKDLLVAGVGRR